MANQAYPNACFLNNVTPYKSLFFMTAEAHSWDLGPVHSILCMASPAVKSSMAAGRIDFHTLFRWGNPSYTIQKHYSSILLLWDKRLALAQRLLRRKGNS